jgi:EAL domain-containing protein (putative c-di-GMP-specific phosphodiesterase class I)
LPRRRRRELGIAVGIGTDAERVDLRDAGYEYGQGDLFGPVQAAGTIA